MDLPITIALKSERFVSVEPVIISSSKDFNALEEL